jgi:hypothetical protein
MTLSWFCCLSWRRLSVLFHTLGSTCLPHLHSRQPNPSRPPQVTSHCDVSVPRHLLHGYLADTVRVDATSRAIAAAVAAIMGISASQSTPSDASVADGKTAAAPSVAEAGAGAAALRQPSVPVARRECRVLCVGSALGLLPLLALRAGAAHVTVVDRLVDG